MSDEEIDIIIEAATDLAKTISANKNFPTGFFTNINIGEIEWKVEVSLASRSKQTGEEIL